jgi:hypothetical protein
VRIWFEQHLRPDYLRWHAATKTNRLVLDSLTLLAGFSQSNASFCQSQPAVRYYRWLFACGRPLEATVGVPALAPSSNFGTGLFAKSGTGNVGTVTGLFVLLPHNNKVLPKVLPGVGNNFFVGNTSSTPQTKSSCHLERESIWELIHYSRWGC